MQLLEVQAALIQYEKSWEDPKQRRALAGGTYSLDDTLLQTGVRYGFDAAKWRAIRPERLHEPFTHHHGQVYRLDCEHAYRAPANHRRPDRMDASKKRLVIDDKGSRRR